MTTHEHKNRALDSLMERPCRTGNSLRSWVALQGTVNLQGSLFARPRLRRVLAVLVPDACLLCDAPAGDIPNLCPGCAAALTHAPYRGPARIVAFRYASPISSLIHRMKFEASLPAARTLGTLLADAIAIADPPLPDAILPVPLHRDRLRQRGFNQALELARPVSRRVGRPVLVRACTRIHATRPQTLVRGLAQRKRNLAGVFRIDRPLTDLRCVAIVDDVVTTGTTVLELARTLRGAGVKRVLIWACAGRPRSDTQASRFATDSALVSMNSRRGST